MKKKKILFSKGSSGGKSSGRRGASNRIGRAIRNVGKRLRNLFRR